MTFIKEERMALIAVLVVVAAIFASGWAVGSWFHTCPVLTGTDMPMKKAWEDTSKTIRNFPMVEKSSGPGIIVPQKKKKNLLKEFSPIIDSGDTLARANTDSTIIIKPFSASDSVVLGSGHALRTEFSFPPAKWKYNFYEAPDTAVSVSKIFTNTKFVEVDRPPNWYWESAKALLFFSGGAYIGYSVAK